MEPNSALQRDPLTVQIIEFQKHPCLNFKNINALNCSKRNLFKVPKAVFKIEALHMLLLNNNHLSSIPDEIVSLKHLIFLDVTGNPLIGDQLLSLMKNVESMPSLRFLRMPLNKKPYYPCGFINCNGERWLSLKSKPIKSRFAWLCNLSGIPPKKESGIVVVKDKPEVPCSRKVKQKA